MTSDPSRQADILGTALQALAWMSMFAAAALLVTAAVLNYPRAVIAAVLVLLPSLFLDPALANIVSAFNARFRLDYVALFQIAQSLVYGAVAVVAITASFGIVGLAVATVVASSSAAALAILLLRAKLQLSPRLKHPPRRVLRFVVSAIPIGGISLVAVVYARIDVVMLSVLANSTSVAFYTVPYSLVRMSWILPSVVSAAFFPLLSRRLESNRSEAEYLFFLVVRVFLFLSVPVSMLLALCAPTVLPLVFGDAYSKSVTVLQIMTWTSVFGFQNYVLWYGVLAARKERAAFVIQLLGLVVNVAINALAIPRFGPSGAATALIVSDLVVVVGQGVLIHRNLFPVPVGGLLTKPLVASAIVLPFAVLVTTRTAVGGALLGAAAYALVLTVLRYVTLEEWTPLVAVLRGPVDWLKRGRPRPA